ncbi:hypothetical protein ACQP3F_29190, partial [Escherichia coli]
AMQGKAKHAFSLDFIGEIEFHLAKARHGKGRHGHAWILFRFGCGDRTTLRQGKDRPGFYFDLVGDRISFWQGNARQGKAYIFFTFGWVDRLSFR